jgi:glycosyltransferase involved in cell wall biosynthesis
MGNHSGYDMLCEALISTLDKHYSITNNVLKGNKRFIRKILQKRIGDIPPVYSLRNLRSEIKVLLHKPFSQKLVHFTYGENDLGIFSSRNYKKRHKIVVTIHQPHAWWIDKKIDITRKFKNIDAVIVLSSEEKELFNQYYPNKFHFIPHGIDTDFYMPEETVQKSKSCLFVGQWMRDFGTLYETVKICKTKDPDITFDLVIPEVALKQSNEKEVIRELVKHPNVNWHKGISDQELRGLYQKSSLLLLPVHKATANNAILEALATGLPIITTDLPALRDYTSKESAILCKYGDAVNTANELFSLLNNQSKLEEMSKAAREHAVNNLSWKIIAKRILDIYNNIS